MIYLILIQFFDKDEKLFLIVARQITYERSFLASNSVLDKAVWTHHLLTHMFKVVKVAIESQSLLNRL